MSSRSDVAGTPGSEAVGFMLAAFAAWRVTHLIAYEDGPGDVVAVVRGRLGDSFLGGLADCFDCLGIWVAAGLAATLGTGRPWLIRAVALAGAASLLERATGRVAAAIEPFE